MSYTQTKMATYAVKIMAMNGYQRHDEIVEGVNTQQKAKEVALQRCPGAKIASARRV